MPRVRALITDGGRKVGDEFNLTDDEARLLCAKDALGGQKAEYVARVMTTKDDDDALTLPGTYRRRDMRARK